MPIEKTISHDRYSSTTAGDAYQNEAIKAEVLNTGPTIAWADTTKKNPLHQKQTSSPSLGNRSYTKISFDEKGLSGKTSTKICKGESESFDMAQIDDVLVEIDRTIGDAKGNEQTAGDATLLFNTLQHPRVKPKVVIKEPSYQKVADYHRVKNPIKSSCFAKKVSEEEEELIRDFEKLIRKSTSDIYNLFSEIISKDPVDLAFLSDDKNASIEGLLTTILDTFFNDWQSISSSEIGERLKNIIRTQLKQDRIESAIENLLLQKTQQEELKQAKFIKVLSEATDSEVRLFAKKAFAGFFQDKLDQTISLEKLIKNIVIKVEQERGAPLCPSEKQHLENSLNSDEFIRERIQSLEIIRKDFQKAKQVINESSSTLTENYKLFISDISKRPELLGDFEIDTLEEKILDKFLSVFIFSKIISKYEQARPWLHKLVKKAISENIFKTGVQDFLRARKNIAKDKQFKENALRELPRLADTINHIARQALATEKFTNKVYEEVKTNIASDLTYAFARQLDPHNRGDKIRWLKDQIVFQPDVEQLINFIFAQEASQVDEGKILGKGVSGVVRQVSAPYLGKRKVYALKTGPRSEIDQDEKSGLLLNGHRHFFHVVGKMPDPLDPSRGQLLMELVNGKTVSKRRIQSTEEILKFMAQLKSAFQHAENQKVIPNDVHLNNMMVNSEDDLVLIDVGRYKKVDQITNREKLMIKAEFLKALGYLQGQFKDDSKKHLKAFRKMSFENMLSLLKEFKKQNDQFYRDYNSCQEAFYNSQFPWERGEHEAVEYCQNYFIENLQALVQGFRREFSNELQDLLNKSLNGGGDLKELRREYQALKDNFERDIGTDSSFRKLLSDSFLNQSKHYLNQVRLNLEAKAAKESRRQTTAKKSTTNKPSGNEYIFKLAAGLNERAGTVLGNQYNLAYRAGVRA